MMGYLSRDDLKRLHEMMAEYYSAVQRKSHTPAGVPVHLHIANDIVSQAVEPLLAEHAALREIVEAVASIPDEDYEEQCPFCRESPGYVSIRHLPDCPVTKARKLLGTEPDA